LDVFDFTSPFAYPRVGVVVPKHRRNSVERNQLKRRLREVLRLQVLPRLSDRSVSVDVLVRARREAYDASFEQLNDELVEYVEKTWSRER
jgi:ribonuclease P protein component